MLDIVEQTTGAEVNVVIKDQPHLKVVFRTSDLRHAFNHRSLLFHLQDFVELSSSLVCLKQTGRYNKSLEVVKIVVVIRPTFW